MIHRNDQKKRNGNNSVVGEGLGQNFGRRRENENTRTSMYANARTFRQWTRVRLFAHFNAVV